MSGSSNDQSTTLSANKQGNDNDHQQQQQQQQQQQLNGDNGHDIVPQLSTFQITFREVQIATKVLTAIGQQVLLDQDKQKRSTSKSSSSSIDKRGNAGDNRNSNDDKKEGTSSQHDQPTKHDFYQHSNLRPLRKAIHPILQLHSHQMYTGQTKNKYSQNRLNQQTLKRQKLAETISQQKHINNTKLRKGRVEKLNQLKSDAKLEEENKIQFYQQQGGGNRGDLLLEHEVNIRKEQQMLMIPDGHVDTTATTTNEAITINITNLQPDENETTTTTTTTTLPKLRSCYVCKIRYREMHHFYDQLCPPCASLNYQKRHQSTPLHNKVAIVTGSRVKIGYQTVLKLLRAGCTVIATTRFPNVAAQHYQKEADFHQWKHLLMIYGLDLRDVIGLELFITYMKMKLKDLGGVDIIINNACQTVRRPTAYYKPLVEQEEMLWTKGDDVHRQLLHGCMDFESLRHKVATDQNANNKSNSSIESGKVEVSQEGHILQLLGQTKDGSLTKAQSNSSSAAITTSQTSLSSSFQTTGISHSSAMSQMVLLPEDVIGSSSSQVLPPGLADINGQQVDLRTSNSWLLTLNQVSTPELIECMFINAIAPFVLNSRLQSLLLTIPNGSTNENDRPDRYIINVSAMEGKFYRYKMPNHPHTNMAKASLNMMTRTSAEDLAKKHRIFMNSVDTVSGSNTSILKANNFFIMVP